MNLMRLLSLISIVVFFAGCGQQYDGDRRFALSGNVTIDGTPIDYGAISFIPAEGDKQRVSGGTIVEGAYSIPEETGANQGKYRVEIRWFKKTGKQFFDPDTETMLDKRDEGLPAKFHKNSTLTADVSDDQTKFDFDLKSK